jgi:hypothetical protein
MAFKEWLLDVTNPETAFIPIDGESIIWGFTMIQDHSPGPLVGVVSENGQEHVEEWISQNPSWREDYSFNSTNP